MRRRTYGNDISGKYQIVLSYSKMYCSSDYGKTFVERIINSNFQPLSAAISSSGQYQVVGTGSGYAYISSDYGITWSERYRISDGAKSVAMSSDGKYITFASSGGKPIRSSDYGKTWNYIFTILSSSCVFMSYDGKYQIISETTGFIHISSDYGSTWNYKPRLESRCESGAISANGKYQTIGLVYPNSKRNKRSEDYGATWTDILTIWDMDNFITMSADGKFQIRIYGSNLVISTDYGKTWAVKTGLNLGGTISSICLSGDCKFQLVCLSQFLYTSKDYGVTWEKRDIFNSFDLRFATINK